MTFSGSSTTSSPPTSSGGPFVRLQRRRARRRPLNAAVMVLAPYDGAGVTINASRGGLRVAVDCVLSAGDDCRLRLDIPGKPPRLVRASVVWSQQVGDGCIAGLTYSLPN